MGGALISSGLHWLCDRIRQDERHLWPAAITLCGLDPLFGLLVGMRIFQVDDISVRRGTRSLDWKLH